MAYLIGLFRRCRQRCYFFTYTMKNNIKYATLALLIALAACTPKTGEKTKSAGPSGTAPKITIPTGDVRKNAPKAGDAPAIQIGKAETFELDNGLKVILVENHKLPQVSFRVFVDYQPVLQKDAAGYVSLMGEMLTKGTATRTKNAIDSEIDFIGANLFANSNGVNASCLSKHTEKVLDLMSDVLLNPIFPQDEFDKAKKRVESGIASQKTDANAIANNVGARLRFSKSHPYGEFTTEETLKNINLEQVKKHYATYFKPNISYLVITGDITKGKAEQFAKKYFGKWQKGEVPKALYAIPRAPDSTVVDFVHKPGAVQSVVNITYPVELMPGTEEAIYARILNTTLGGYFNSRLNANLREGHGWTYGARSSLRPDDLIGSFNANASVRNAVTDSSVIEFLKEMDLLRNKKIPNSELSVVKNVLTGQFSRSLEEPGTIADFALTAARFNLPADYYQTYLAKLNAATPEQMLAIAQKFIKTKKAHILIVGNRDDVASRLAQFSKTGKINFYDANGEPVRDVNTSLPPGMDGKKLIGDYLAAIGGTEKAVAVKDVQSSVSMKSRGMAITVNQAQKVGNKLAMEMLMSGQSMGKTLLNGDKAIQTGQGGAKRDITGAQLDDLKEQSLPIKELNYLTSGYQLVLKGIEDVNGKAAYLLEVTTPNGSKRTEYYEVATSLKIREVSSQKGVEGGETTVINDYEDYREVSGVKFPYTTTTTGIFPTSMKATVSELKVNAGVDDKVFEF
jgi:zinc protease